MRFVIPNLSGACFLSAKPNSVRLLEKIPLLHAEAAAVKTTKLIIPAAKGIPIKANNLTNGLSLGSNSFHGIIEIITANAPM